MVNGMPKTHAAVSHMGKEQIKHPSLEKDGAASGIIVMGMKGLLKD